MYHSCWFCFSYQVLTDIDTAAVALRLEHTHWTSHLQPDISELKKFLGRKGLGAFG